MAHRGRQRGDDIIRNGTKGKNRLILDFGGFENIIEELDKLGANLQEIVGEAYENAGEELGVLTEEAMDDANLPAQGKYSHDKTIAAVIKNPKMEWEGPYGEMGVGFDESMPGGFVGKLLITGTPKMRPDFKLEDLYARKKIIKKLNKIVCESLSDALSEAMEG